MAKWVLVQERAKGEVNVYRYHPDDHYDIILGMYNNEKDALDELQKLRSSRLWGVYKDKDGFMLVSYVDDVDGGHRNLIKQGYTLIRAFRTRQEAEEYKSVLKGGIGDAVCQGRGIYRQGYKRVDDSQSC